MNIPQRQINDLGLFMFPGGCFLVSPSENGFTISLVEFNVSTKIYSHDTINLYDKLKCRNICREL